MAFISFVITLGDPLPSGKLDLYKNINLIVKKENRFSFGWPVTGSFYLF